MPASSSTSRITAFSSGRERQVARRSDGRAISPFVFNPEGNNVSGLVVVP